MTRLCFLDNDALGLLAATALKAARPELSIRVVESQVLDNPYVMDNAGLDALDKLLPGSGVLLRVGSQPLPRLVVQRDQECLTLENGGIEVIAGATMQAILRGRAQQHGVEFISAPRPDDIVIASDKDFPGYVALPLQVAHSDYRFLFAGEELVHGRVVGGPTAMLYSYGVDRARAKAAQKILVEAFGLRPVEAGRAAGAAAARERLRAVDAGPVNSFVLGVADTSAALEFSALSALAGTIEDFVAAWTAGAVVVDVAQRFAQAQAARAATNQHATRNLADWYANAGRYRKLPLAQFAYAMLSASQRIGHDALAQAYPDFVRQVEGVIAGNLPLPPPMPPMFAPLRLRAMSVVNRVVVSPMCMYSATDGMPDDFHLVHLGARALGGAGLLFTEMTAVSEEGRISPGCTGIYSDEQAASWRRIVEFVHRCSPARIGLQLGHAGPKASTQLGWQRMDAPLEDGNWPIVAASNIAFGLDNQVPMPLDEAEMARIERAYGDAARRAIGCGFDMLELHAAHGYLLSSFISPLTNRRGDQYGGSLENRLRFPLRVFAAIRKVWPQDKPISVRISAHDWAAGGTTDDDAVIIAAAFKDAGADAISVSTGQTTRLAKPLYGRMYQVPFADRIRNEVGIATIAVGAITDADQVNSIVAAGRADLCALARPHLTDPHWTLHAALDQGVKQQAWPRQYIAGRFQAERELGKGPGRTRVRS